MMIVTGPDGAQVPIYARQGPGYVDTVVRATSRAAFEQAALSRGIMIEVDGAAVPSPGVSLDHLGAVVVTPGTYDADGAEITPPVLDPRHHVNMRISEPALSVPDADFPSVASWVMTGIAWSVNGTDDEQINAAESAKVLFGVALIDPDSINSPSRVWA